MGKIYRVFHDFRV